MHFSEVLKKLENSGDREVYFCRKGWNFGCEFLRGRLVYENGQIFKEIYWKNSDKIQWRETWKPRQQDFLAKDWRKIKW